MLQLVLFGLAKVLQRFIVWCVAFPALLILSTPVIFVRAAILAGRKRQRFRHAVADGYDFLCSLSTPLGFSRGS
jgi:hypothetical protein